MQLLVALVLLVCGSQQDSQSTFKDINVALKKSAFQMNTQFVVRPTFTIPGTASNAVDGNKTPNFFYHSCTMTHPFTGWGWWMVDLGNNFTIRSTRIVGRQEYSRFRLRNFTIEISEEDPRKLTGFPGRTNGSGSSVCASRGEPIIINLLSLKCNEPIKGRYIRVLTYNLNQYVGLSICEFEAYETDITDTSVQSTQPSIAFQKPTRQSSTRKAKFITVSGNAVDGNRDNCFENYSNTEAEKVAWFLVDLEELFAVNSITITGPCHCHQHAYLQNITVQISIEDPTALNTFPDQIDTDSVCMRHEGLIPDVRPNTYNCEKIIIGRYVLIIRGEVNGGQEKQLRICELDVHGKPFVNKRSSCFPAKNTDTFTGQEQNRSWSYSLVDQQLGNPIEERRHFISLCVLRHSKLEAKKKQSLQYILVDLESLTNICLFLEKKENSHASSMERWVQYKLE